MPDSTRLAADWYIPASLAAGHMHLLALNSEVDMAPGSAQWNFAAADLAAVNRSHTPFVVVQWHRLMYSASPTSNSDYSWGDTVGARWCGSRDGSWHV